MSSGGERVPEAVERNGVLDSAAPAEAQLRLAREFLQATLDTLPARMAVLDECGGIVMTNRAWRTFAEVNGVADIVDAGVNYLSVCDGSSDGDALAKQVGIGLRELIDGWTSTFTLEYPCAGPSGEQWFALRASRYTALGNARVIVAHDDVTARREAETEVLAQAGLLDQLGVSVIAVDVDGRLTSWNEGAERLFGWRRAEVLGRNAADLLASHDEERVLEAIAESERDGRWDGQLLVAHKDGSEFPAQVHSRQILDANAVPVGRTAVFVDVSERVASERALLGAGNYLRAVTDGMGEGLCTLDAAGHISYMNKAGEQLLGWSEQELQGCALHDLVHAGKRDGRRCTATDCQMLSALEGGDPVRVEDDLFTDRDGVALPIAYAASPFATDDGLGGWAIVFGDIAERKASQEAMQQDVETLSWIGRVQDALVEDRFELYAQPIIDVRSGQVVQRELLLRMCEPDGKIIAPAAYLPIAESYGLVTHIDYWVIERAMQIAVETGAVQLNLSARSIGDPRTINQIETCLRQTGVDPACLVFEITETALVADAEAGKALANRLHALGCKLALDDFGTGYGGFTYLKQFPVDFLKIDIEFVRDLTTVPASQHVVEAVVALARSFGLKTVAEGVEDAAVLEMVSELGVDFAQGYHIARPAPLARVGRGVGSKRPGS